MGNITKRALLGAAPLALFALSAWGQDEPPQKPSES